MSESGRQPPPGRPADEPSGGPGDPLPPVSGPTGEPPRPADPPAPHFDDTRPLPPLAPSSGQPAYTYAVQDLSEQQVDKPRRHTGLYAAIALGVVVVAIAAVVFLVTGRDDGDRAAYCDKLRSATAGGDLASAVGSANAGDLDALADLAPEPVAKPWADLVKVRDALQGGGSLKDVNVAQLGDDLATIVSDAKSECGVTIDLPLGGLSPS